jgi:predicted aspartyl protease
MQVSAKETPFQLIGAAAKPLVLVPSHVNNTGPYSFLLDSGATHCLIYPELASNLGIQSESEEEAFGAGGAVQLCLARVHSVAVGSAKQENTQVVITHDLERIGARLKATVGGAIGFTFLKDFRVTLDYERKVLWFVRPSGGGDETSHFGSSTPFTLTPSGPPILLQAFANGQGPFQFTLDTGAGQSVISPDLADRLSVRSEKAIVGTGVGGETPMSRARLESLTVGDATVRDHIVVIGGLMEALSMAAGAKMDGIIGNNFLNQFRVTLDYPQSRLGFAVSKVL